MALLAIIISLVIERFLGSMESLRRFEWFEFYLEGLLPRLTSYSPLNGAGGVLLLILPILAVLFALDYALMQGWLVLLGLAFSVLVLLLSFGPADLEAEVEAYIDAQERGDDESARWHASDLIRGEPPEDRAQLTRYIIESTLVEANERLFAVLFWFLILGPAGALLYRLTSQMVIHVAGRDSGFADAARRLHSILAWLPARVCVLAYALAGSFVGVLQAWRAPHGTWQESSRAVLIAGGLGALGIEDTLAELQEEQELAMVTETLALVRRAVLVLLAIIALSTLAGWMA